MTLPVMIAHLGRNSRNRITVSLLGDRLSTERIGAPATWQGCLLSSLRAAAGAVAFAESTEEVSAIVKICAQHKVPLLFPSAVAAAWRVMW